MKKKSNSPSGWKKKKHIQLKLKFIFKFCANRSKPIKLFQRMKNHLNIRNKSRDQHFAFPPFQAFRNVHLIKLEMNKSHLDIIKCFSFVWWTNLFIVCLKSNPNSLQHWLCLFILFVTQFLLVSGCAIVDKEYQPKIANRQWKRKKNSILFIKLYKQTHSYLNMRAQHTEPPTNTGAHASTMDEMIYANYWRMGIRYKQTIKIIFTLKVYKLLAIRYAWSVQCALCILWRTRMHWYAIHIDRKQHQFNVAERLFARSVFFSFLVFGSFSNAILLLAVLPFA